LLERFKKLKTYDLYHPLDLGDGNVIAVNNQDEYKGLKRWGFLKKHLPPLQGKRVIDFGCSGGIFTTQAVRDGASYGLGLDTHLPYLEEAEFIRDYFSEKDETDYTTRLEFKQSRIEKDSLLDYGKFDIAFCLRFLYHFNRINVDRILGQVRQMAPCIAIQGSYESTNYMCSAIDIIFALFRHKYTDITLYNTKQSNGSIYRYFLVIGKQENES